METYSVRGLMLNLSDFTEIKKDLVETQKNQGVNVQRVSVPVKWLQNQSDKQGFNKWVDMVFEYIKNYKL